MASKSKVGKRPPPKEDELSTEVALRAKLDDTGLTVAGRSRAVSALDRLLGGAIGIPAAALEGLRERQEIRNHFKGEALRIEGEKLLERLGVGGGLAEATARRIIGEEIQFQLNRESVWVAAIEHLQSQSSESVEDSGGDEIDADWINIFSSYSNHASSERLRSLWGRILAGEIRQPGSFAPSTLRVISELDAEIARSFEDVVKNRIDRQYVMKPKDLRNQELIKYSFLEECGLLQDVSMGFQLTKTVGDDGFVTMKTDNYFIRIKQELSKDLKYSGIRITRIGQQLCSILEWDEIGALTEFSSQLSPSSEVNLYRILDQSPDGHLRGTLVGELPTGTTLEK